MTNLTRKRRTKQECRLQEKQPDRILSVVAQAHGLTEEEVLSTKRYREIKRAQHQFKCLITDHMGVREAARRLDCSPALVIYTRRVHKEMLASDAFYKETYEQILRQLESKY